MTALSFIRKNSRVNFKLFNVEVLSKLPDWSDKTILIAEDVDNNYAVLAALLKKTQVNLIRAKNGKEALKMVWKDIGIDLILMDLSMPIVNGIEATRIIKKQFPEKIVIAHTAHELSEEITRENFNDILLKPIRRNQLIDTLSKYLS